jgi:hypothetical protein
MRSRSGLRAIPDRLDVLMLTHALAFPQVSPAEADGPSSGVVWCHRAPLWTPMTPSESRTVSKDAHSASRCCRRRVLGDSLRGRSALGLGGAPRDQNESTDSPAPPRGHWEPVNVRESTGPHPLCDNKSAAGTCGTASAKSRFMPPDDSAESTGGRLG